MNSNDRLISGYDADGWTGTYEGVDTPQITVLESLPRGVSISWSRVDGAKGYRVFYLGRNGWVRLEDTKGTSMLDTDVRPGGTYTYTVRCLGDRGNYISAYNPVGSTIKYNR